MSTILAGVIIAGVAAAVALLAAMLYRDEPLLGAIGLFVLMIAGVFAAVYGTMFAN